MKKGEIPCCFCDDFTSSTARGVKIHIRAKHNHLLWMRNRLVRHGRPPKDACEICGMVHQYDGIQLEGMATHIRKLERPKAGIVTGRTPKGLAPGETISLGELTVPKGASRIKQLGFLVEAPGRFDLKIGGKKYSFEVRSGFGRRVA